ncbi:MAG: chloride channel protein [Candidatus Nanopelagicales bacterium]
MSDAASGAGHGSVLKLLGTAAVIGIAAGAGAIAFLGLEHNLTSLLWDDLPEVLGGTPGWWVFLVLGVGAVGVWGALKLPGHGGHRPLDGLGTSTGPKVIGSVLVAALISLSIGAVVGPEAPLMGVGSAIGGAIAFKAREQGKQVLMIAGSVAAITMILGNPMISAVLVLEAAVLKGGPGGRRVMVGLLPVMIAMGFGYLIQIGVGDWDGVGQAQLQVPGLPAYDTVQGIDLAMALVVGLVSAVFAVLAVEAGTRFQDRVRNPLTGLLAAAMIVATMAVAARAVTGESVDLVLFSGQSAIGSALTITSVSVLLVIAVAKTIAYAVSLGAGFRGGMVFPAVYLGVVVATGASQLVTGSNLSALAAAGMAAAVSGVMRLPFTGVLLALLLCAGAGMAVTTPAIIGAVIGVLVRFVADEKLAPQEVAAPE